MTKKLKIEKKRVPAPKRPAARRGRPVRFPWNEMKIGESFFTKDEDILVGNANARYAPKRFTAQREPKGTRIWRIK